MGGIFQHRVTIYQSIDHTPALIIYLNERLSSSTHFEPDLNVKLA